LQLTINNNSTATDNTSSRILLFKRQAVDTVGVGGRSFGVQISCNAVSADSTEEDYGECVDNISTNQGPDHQSGLSREDDDTGRMQAADGDVGTCADQRSL
jgi:hypothetical protein